MSPPAGEMTIRTATVTDSAEMAEIHLAALPDDFSLSLGIRYLADVFYPTVTSGGSALPLVACRSHRSNRCA